MNFSNWKPRSHYVGILMTDATGKSNLDKYLDAKKIWQTKEAEFEDMNDKQKDSKTGAKADEAAQKAAAEMARLLPIKDEPCLGETCTSKLHEIWVELTKERKKFIASKYLEKGLLVEEDSITLYSQVTGKFHKKNELPAENDWVTGHMDIDKDEDTLVDTKSSWDALTFYDSTFSPVPKINHWQVDCYMWLYNKKRAEIAYCLINTPEHLIKAEELKMMYKMFGNEMNMKIAPEYMLIAYEDAKKEIRKNHIFDDIPVKERVFIFNIKRDDTRIDRIKKRVEDCRWYLNKIDKMRNNDTES